jgi:lipoprotein-anchoring transpeptidase ErfK/SrfK
MRFWLLWGALAAVAFADPSAAQTDDRADAAQNGVPTVTILNKASETSEAVAPPTLEVSPQRPAAAAPFAAPAPQPSAVTAPAETTTAPGSAVATDVAATKPAEPAPQLDPTLTINVDLSRQQMTVSEHGVTLHTWPISSARYGHRTPTGTFQPTWMTKMWYSRQYDYAPMPYSIFFHQGVAIHATYAIRALGRPASHGCVRLEPRNAAELFRLVAAHGKERTQIVVHGRADHSSDEMASAAPRSRGTEEEPVRYRRESPYRYLPPNSYRRAANRPPPGYAYAPRTKRGYYAAPRRPPRGLYSYGYGF